MCVFHVEQMSRCYFWERFSGWCLVSNVNQTIISLEEWVLASFLIPQCHTCPVLHSPTLNVLWRWQLYYETLLCRLVPPFADVYLCMQVEDLSVRLFALCSLESFIWWGLDKHWDPTSMCRFSFSLTRSPSTLTTVEMSGYYCFPPF